MNKNYEELTELRFIGKRFEDHMLPISSLSDIISFRNILREMGEKILDERGENKKQIDELAEIKIAGIKPGSVSLILRSKVQEITQLDLLERIQGVIKDSLNRILDLLSAINEDRRLPERFPRETFIKLRDWGSNLEEGERIELRTSFRDPVGYSRTSMQKIGECIMESYEDEVDIIGEIYLVDIKNKSFKMLSDEKCITLHYSENKENELLNALMRHGSTEIRVKGMGIFSWRGDIEKIIEIYEIIITDIQKTGERQDYVSIWEKFEEVASEVSNEVWERFPSGYLENLDKYVYGGNINEA